MNANDKRDKKTVTVIIPVYNMERYISYCLDSILSQTLNDLEIICVDDGSTDSSLSIMQEYKEKHPEILIYEQKRLGPAVARNLALQKASGEFVSFLDSDDYYYDADSLKILYEGAKNNRASIAGGGRIKDEGGILSQTRFHFKNEGEINVKNLDSYGGFTRYIYNLTFLRDNQIVFPDYIRFQDEVFLATAFSCIDTIWVTKKDVYVARSFDKIVNYYSKRVINNLVYGYRDIAMAAIRSDYQRLLEYNVMISKKMTGVLCAHIIAGNTEVRDVIGEVREIISNSNLSVDLTGSIFAMTETDIEQFFMSKREQCSAIKKQLEEKKAIVFGAGVIGKHAYDIVGEKALFLGFAVTKKEENTLTARGYAVRNLIEYKDDKDALVIIAVEKDSAASEMQAYANSLGFKNTTIINDIFVDYDSFSVEDGAYAY